MTPAATSFRETRRRPRWWVIALVALGHVLAFYGLVRAFAPDTVASLEREVLATFNVTITAPPPPPPPPPPASAPDEGAAGSPGKQAVPKSVTAPTPRLPVARPSPAPRATSTGDANSSGARDSGAGTGAAGSGEGTGSGRGGDGQGGGAVSGVTVRSGSIDESRDFPVPDGGREVRAGTSVTVAFTVGTDGRASDCRVVRPGPDPRTNALLCPLVVERIRFNPARNAAGQPVAARYGWRQEFFRR